jgi:hypothetical protein
LIARSGDITRVDSDKIGKDFGLSFLAESQPYEMFKPLYRVQEIARGQSGLSLISAVGSASVTWGNGGYVYFIPTTLDGWWSTSGNASALYVANIVSNAAWGYYYASGNSDIQAVNGTVSITNISIFTNKLVQRVDAGRITQANGRLFIKTDKINDSVKAGKMVQFQFQAAPNGRIDNLDSFSSSSITGKDLSLTYSLNESVLREEEVFLEVWNSSGTNVRTMPIGRISLQVSQAGFPFPATLPSGDYILKIVDPTGTSLAQSYLHLAPFTIEPQSLGWDLKLFIFNVFAEGETKTPYLGEIKPVKISLDGADEKEVRLINGKLSYESTFFPGPGKHVFKFVIGDDVITKEINFVREPSFIEKYWYMILTIIVVFGIAFAIRRPEKAEFSVDVPDFPPLHAIAIPIKRETILAMFSSINKELRWEYTPLSLQDLKTGFRKMSYQGRPVIVGDYNLEHILDRLVEEGQLKHALDYYGLVSWEKESKMSIYRLAMQRALRDLFVIEGIPFIPFGQKTDCDTVVSFGGEKVMLHIYEDDSIINRAVQTASQGRSIIVFEDEQTMKDFTARIHSSSETNVIFKILLDDANGNIFLSPINRLVDTLDKKYSPFYY